MLRAANIALLPLVLCIGLTAQTAFGSTIDQLQPVQQLPVQQLQGSTLKSPNGQFTLSVTDAGIVMSGPGGSVRIDNTSVQVSSTMQVSVTGTARVQVSAPDVQLTGASTLEATAPAVALTGTSTLRANAPVVTLNGACRPVARVGDVVTSVAPYGGGATVGSVTTGSTSVYSC